ncbi:uncharacterized protein ARMOST_15278 [Armillaria ostoyae]|uniref:Uncharacterized protein n=1 Tax=Armillaria ostoyae TaxID=47428 RepID=A0A284RSY8_ARMOS|nr:uncharacterized protein ARMOST_15278 [Armillaria ostoyae]
MYKILRESEARARAVERGPILGQSELRRNRSLLLPAMMTATLFFQVQALRRSPTPPIGNKQYILTTTPGPRRRRRIQKMTETTVAICLSALWCSLFPWRLHLQIRASALQELPTLHSTNSWHRQLFSLPAQTIDVGDAPGARMAQHQRDTMMYRARIFTSFVIRCTNLQILATIAPAHPRIATISKKFRPFVSAGGYGAEVIRGRRRFFLAEKTYSSGITMSKDLTSTRLPSLSRHFTYRYIQPTNPEACIHSQDRTPFASVTSAIPSNTPSLP